MSEQKTKTIEQQKSIPSSQNDELPDDLLEHVAGGSSVPCTSAGEGNAERKN